MQHFIQDWALACIQKQTHSLIRQTRTLRSGSAEVTSEVMGREREVRQYTYLGASVKGKEDEEQGQVHGKHETIYEM